MGRRFKIITTFCSMILAVVTLSYGVYAALQTSYNVTSQMSFTPVNVLVEVTGVKVYQGDLVSNVVTKQQTAVKNVTSGFYSEAFNPAKENENPTVELGGLTFNDTANKVIRRYLVFEVYYKNYSENAVNVTVEALALPTNVEFRSHAGASVTTFSTTLSAATGVTTPSATQTPTSTANAADKAFVIILYLTDITQKFTDQTLSLGVIFSKA